MTKEELKAKLKKQIELIDSLDFKIDEISTIIFFYDIKEKETRLIAGYGKIHTECPHEPGQPYGWEIIVSGNGILAYPREDS